MSVWYRSTQSASAPLVPVPYVTSTMAGPSKDTSLESNDSEKVLHEEPPYRMMQVDSEDIPPSPPMSPEPFFQQLLKRMNPAECLTPTTTDALKACSGYAYSSCIASDREELEWVLPELLRDIRGAHKARSAALHRLYRLTDREYAHNR